MFVFNGFFLCRTLASARLCWRPSLHKAQRAYLHSITQPDCNILLSGCDAHVNTCECTCMLPCVCVSKVILIICIHVQRRKTRKMAMIHHTALAYMYVWHMYVCVTCICEATSSVHGTFRGSFKLWRMSICKHSFWHLGIPGQVPGILGGRTCIHIQKLKI